MKLKKLVIPFDPPVQVAACSIVSPALISIKAVRHSGREQSERTRKIEIIGARFRVRADARPGMTAQVSTSPVLEPLAAESLWPWGSAR